MPSTLACVRARPNVPKPTLHAKCRTVKQSVVDKERPKDHRHCGQGGQPKEAKSNFKQHIDEWALKHREVNQSVMIHTSLNKTTTTTTTTTKHTHKKKIKQCCLAFIK